MNPITAIERLINEHGSAKILQERLALAADQFTVLERENTDLRVKLGEAEAKLGVLESRNSNLEHQVKKLESEASNNQESHTLKWGCFVFEGDKTLYCPACWVDRGKKMPTSRASVRARFCPGCKTAIPTG
jgi:hypothetical protein